MSEVKPVENISKNLQSYLPNPVKSLVYIKCYSSSSPRPVKSQFHPGLESPFSEGTPPFWVPPSFWSIFKKLPPSLFLRAIQIGACKLYETFQNEGVTFHTILSQFRISLSLLFIISGSTLYLLLTLWLDIAFNIFHIWYPKRMNMKHF